MMCDLSEKKIIVTGASSGLGRAAAVKLSALNAKVCLIGRDEAKLKETLSLMKTKGHLMLSADLKDFETYDDLFKKITGEMGKLDGLVHFAGIYKVIPLKIMKVDSIKEMLDINLLAFFELLKHFTKKNNVHDEGASIVGISSVASLKGAPALSGYASSKAALDGAVRSLACELAPRKIRVNSIAPGYVETSLSGEQLPPEAIDRIRNAHPLGAGDPEDVANLVAFLLSNEAKWITGSTITIDGGFSIVS